MAETAALVIAIGEVDGRPLALGGWGRRSVLEHVVETVRDSGIDHIVVVLGPAADDVVAVTDLGDATIVIDPEWAEGPAASIRCGLDELMRRDDAVEAVLLVAEQPEISGSVIAAAVSARHEAGTPAAIPKYRYATGLPLVVHRDLWPRLMGLESDASPEAFFKAHPGWVHEMWVDRLAPATVSSADELEAIAPRA